MSFGGSTCGDDPGRAISQAAKQWRRGSAATRRTGTGHACHQRLHSTAIWHVTPFRHIHTATRSQPPAKRAVSVPPSTPRTSRRGAVRRSFTPWPSQIAKPYRPDGQERSSRHSPLDRMPPPNPTPRGSYAWRPELRGAWQQVAAASRPIISRCLARTTGRDGSVHMPSTPVLGVQSDSTTPNPRLRRVLRVDPKDRNWSAADPANNVRRVASVFLSREASARKTHAVISSHDAAAGPSR